MQKGDFLKVDYTGRVKASGEIFDLTSEEIAKKEKIFDPNNRYGPALVIMGNGMIIPGVEKHLESMKVGEEKKFDVEPNEAFGPRSPKLIRIIPLSKFVENKINPVPGAFLEIDGRNAKIQSVTGGRVRVDFNNPLAGRALSYRIKIVGKIEDKKTQVEEILTYFTVGFSAVSLEADKAVVDLKRKEHGFAKKLVTDMATKNVEGVKSVEFREPEKEADNKAVSNKV